ncbi:AI-2E family transporter [Actinomadura sp. WMMB 499]|uniref:AI-2E family transporter n=1 Tax=Actinomadura sp. WMMB 499 TaxID=1219491 RepID=UPI0012469344|nr:AI-2E family transporter [Actinomadura sp. WMMB 499]QFG21404.1 AI-2E family transporter [Actinomadura sp. WMMB 499]
MTKGKGFDAVPSPLRKAAAVAACFLLIAAAVGLLVYFLVMLAPLTMAIIAALLLTALMSPVARWTRRLRAPAWAGALAGLLTLLLAIAGPVALVTGQAADQWESMRRGLTEGLERARDQLVNGPLPISQRQLDSVVGAITRAAQRSSPDPVAGASMAAEVLAASLIALFLLFFMLKDGKVMWGWLVGLAPERRRARIDAAGRAGWRALVSYVHGIVVIALVDAIGIGLALVLIGVPFALPLTLLTFVAAFVPIAGAIIAGAAAVLIAFVGGGITDALLVLAAVLVVQQAESHLLQPLIMGRTLHLHPVVIIGAVTAGTLLAGIAGAVIAVPIVAVVYRVSAVLAGRDGPTGPESPEPEAPA